MFISEADLIPGQAIVTFTPQQPADFCYDLLDSRKPMVRFEQPRHLDALPASLVGIQSGLIAEPTAWTVPQPGRVEGRVNNFGDQMKICVFGAGAVGGFLAGSLARAGSDEICAVARGKRLDNIQRNGVVVAVAGQTWSVPIRCSDRAGDLGLQDLVLVTLKAPTIPAAAENLRTLVGDNTTVVFILNGIPWWYYYRHGGERDGLQLPALDPDGVIWRSVGPERVVGAVAHCSAIVDTNGITRLDYPNVQFEFGEPDGSNSERLTRVVAAMTTAGLNAVSSQTIRERLWAKLILNMATGPITVLSQQPLREVVTEPGMKNKIRMMLTEAIAIAAAAGFTLAPEIEKIIDKFSVSGHRPSILQDLEAGRPMEIDSLYGVPLEIGRVEGIQAPMLDLLTLLVKARARRDGLY